VRNLRLPSPPERYSQRDEAETRRLIELALLRDTPGTGSGLQSRRTVVFTSASLAAGASVQASFDLGAPGAVLRTILADRAARARFYAIASVQSTDASRAFTTPPPAGTGILGDFIWLTSHTKYVAPHLDLYNADDPADNTIYITVQNLTGSTSTVTLTLEVVSVEA